MCHSVLCMCFESIMYHQYFIKICNIIRITDKYLYESGSLRYPQFIKPDGGNMGYV